MTGQTNWAGNYTYRATAVRHPASIEQLQDLVATNSRIRALGTRHSFSAIADTPGVLVSLDALDPDITIDPARRTVSVTGGTSYGVLAATLQQQGFALPNMGSLPHISVAGGTATGTHGSGDGNGILATAISAVDLITADGSLVTVDRSNPDLSAIAVGLGAFGVIARLTLDIEPSYLVRQDVFVNAPWDAVLDRLDDVLASAYSVSLMGSFAGPVITQLWQKTRLALDDLEPIAGVVQEARFGGTWYDDAHLPAGTGLNPRAGVPGPWSERLPHFRLDSAPSVGGDELQTEYFVGRPHGAAALRVLRSLGEQIGAHLHAAEIRTVAADRLWLSPAFERDSLCIGFTWQKHPAEVEALLPVIEAALAPFAPRPHWGKLSALPPALLADRFSRLGAFAELTRRYDPAGKFAGPVLGAVFAGIAK
ncbi:MAG: FAD-binding protein [Nakamurella sp.]